jgi:hypothetical protein
LSTLRSKEIANFHRPRAKWYPHENKIAAQLQGTACSHGRMAVLLMSLGGKGVKILVNAEDTPVSIKLKASKKFGWYPFTTPLVLIFLYLENVCYAICFLLSSWLLIHVLCNLRPQKERQMVISSSLISSLTALAFCRIEAFREDHIVLFWERASG